VLRELVPQADGRGYKGELHGVGSTEWDMKSVSVAVATKCQGVEVLCSWDGYEVMRDPVDHHQLGVGATML